MCGFTLKNLLADNLTPRINGIVVQREIGSGFRFIDDDDWDVCLIDHVPVRNRKIHSIGPRLFWRDKSAGLDFPHLEVEVFGCEPPFVALLLIRNRLNFCVQGDLRSGKYRAGGSLQCDYPGPGSLLAGPQLLERKARRFQTTFIVRQSEPCRRCFIAIPPAVGYAANV